MRKTIVETLEAPRLERFDLKDLTKFQHARKIYESKVAEKNKEKGVNMTLATYRSSISEYDLEMLVRMKKIDAATVDEVTENDLKNFIETKATVELSEIHVQHVEKAVVNVYMDGNKRGVDRILSFVRAFGTALKRNGLPEILDAKPYLAIRLTLEKIKPVSLKNRMGNIVEMNRDAGFHKKDFRAFMQRMEAEAIKHEEVEEELAR